MPIVTCTACGARYRLPEGSLPRGRGRTRCRKCGAAIVLSNLAAVGEPIPEPTPEPPAAPMAGSRRYSLVVTDGPEAGRTFPLAPPSVTIGREGTDLELDDPEVSRQHASIEIGDEGVTLKDLGSRNGTYVGDERVSEAEIFHHDEFRVGSNVFMLVVTEVE